MMQDLRVYMVLQMCKNIIEAWLQSKYTFFYKKKVYKEMRLKSSKS